jgi:tungstate transport system substrate-binding protein
LNFSTSLINKAGKFLGLALIALLLASLLAGCSLSKKTEETRWFVLATTPDLNNSGLLDVLLPPFEKANNLRVKRLPVSYEKALAYAHDGGVDALLVETNKGQGLFNLAGAPPEIFPFEPKVNASPLTAPTPVPQPTATPSFDNIMTQRKLAFWSDLVMVGPADDKYEVGAQYDAGRAFKWIALKNVPFVVAGGSPGLREVQEGIWRQIGRGSESDRGSGYRIISGDSETALQEAEKQGAYTIVPRYMFLNSGQSGKLKVILDKDPAFYLGYEVSIPNRIRIQDRDVSLASLFVYYLTEPGTQTVITNYKNSTTNNNLFRPLNFRVFIPQ